MALAVRKVAIYGNGHPMSVKAVEKPFLIFNRLFSYKRFVNMNLHRGELWVANIRIKDSVFAGELIRYLQVKDLSVLLFERGLEMFELTRFIDRLLNCHADEFESGLVQDKITHATVNCGLGLELFEEKKRYRGDVGGPLSIRSLVWTDLGDDIGVLADVDSGDPAALFDHRIDWECDILAYMLPEKVAAIPPAEFVRAISRLVTNAASESDTDKQKAITQRCEKICELLRFRHDAADIIGRLQEVFDSASIPPDIKPRLTSPTETIKLQARDEFEERLKKALSISAKDDEAEHLDESFRRLLSTGQADQAGHYLAGLLDYLDGGDAGLRQVAMSITIRCLASVGAEHSEPVLATLIEAVNSQLRRGRETFEYSEIIRQIADHCLKRERFDLMRMQLEALAERRTTKDGVDVYDSMTVKQALTQIARPDVIDAMVDKLTEADHKTIDAIRACLIAMGSEEVAVSLSHIITYPSRQVRQGALRVLAELGKASLKVFSRLVMDDDLFEREEGRHELPDAKWWIVRNSIFVLGSIQDPEGIPSLRLRMSDRDVRVRREILRALERIGGEDACDLLILMADDSDREIAEAAVIAAGMTGTSQMAPLVIDIARRRPSLAVRVIVALGRLGGEQARAWLSEMLQSDDKLAELSRGEVSRDELRVAIVRALGHMGDAESIERLREFNRARTAGRGPLHRPSLLDQVLSEVLGAS